MPNKTPDEIYGYVLSYKNDLKDNYNDDMEKFFNQSNDLNMKLSGQMIVFSSLLISIGAGYLLSTPELNTSARDLIVASIFSFAASVGLGLYSTHAASNFFLQWAKNAHDKGGIVHKDDSKTVEDLERMLEKIGEKSAELKEHNSKAPAIAQIITFAIGIIFVLWATCLVAYYR